MERLRQTQNNRGREREMYRSRGLHRSSRNHDCTSCNAYPCMRKVTEIEEKKRGGGNAHVVAAAVLLYGGLALGALLRVRL
jgi:hypothetical protein